MGVLGRKRALPVDSEEGLDGQGSGEGALKKTRAELMEEIIAKSKMHKVRVSSGLDGWVCWGWFVRTSRLLFFSHRSTHPLFPVRRNPANRRSRPGRRTRRRRR